MKTANIKRAAQAVIAGNESGLTIFDAPHVDAVQALADMSPDIVALTERLEKATALLAETAAALDSAILHSGKYMTHSDRLSRRRIVSAAESFANEVQA